MVMSRYVVIPAAGSGTRFRAGFENNGNAEVLPKQFLFLSYIIQFFADDGYVDGIVCAVPRGIDFLPQTQKVYFVCGGGNRQASVCNALEKVDEIRRRPSGEFDKKCSVLIHDAARPHISKEIVSKLWELLENGENAVIPAVSPVDSVIVDGSYIDRNSVKLIQTPQGFDFDMIYELHKKYAGREEPDDASLCRLEGIDVSIIEGDIRNKKVTYGGDLSHTIRTGFGFDSHQFSDDPSRQLKLCGICIENHRGLIGVSDADVAIHSVIDAMLGALAMGGIGEHFPESSSSSVNADSAKFLAQINSIAAGKGFVVSNLDVTIICDSPEIRKYKDRMTQRIASILETEIENINIKGKTTEGTIAKDGIIAMANVLLTSVA